jgi:hypothetical protein
MQHRPIPDAVSHRGELELQKPALAKALKEGCWAQFQGQYFTCWDETRGQDLPDDYRGPDLRMVIPFAEAPVEWWYPHFTGTDWGGFSANYAIVSGLTIDLDLGSRSTLKKLTGESWRMRAMKCRDTYPKMKSL